MIWLRGLGITQLLWRFWNSPYTCTYVKLFFRVTSCSSPVKQRKRHHPCPWPWVKEGRWSRMEQASCVIHSASSSVYDQWCAVRDNSRVICNSCKIRHYVSYWCTLHCVSCADSCSMHCANTMHHASCMIWHASYFLYVAWCKKHCDMISDASPSILRLASWIYVNQQQFPAASTHNCPHYVFH